VIGTRLAGCQLIVAEGGLDTQGTAGARALTLSYRRAGRARRWGLVTQRLSLGELDVPVVRPDLAFAGFRRGWRRLPFLVRLWAWVLVPVYSLGLLVFGSREFLVRRLGSQEDLPTREEELGFGRFDALQELLVDDRDALLARALDAIHELRSQEPITVAVVYGAAHMPAVVRSLARHGDRATSAEWLTVFGF
jgi:pheromone shutdown protein TraB